MNIQLRGDKLQKFQELREWSDSRLAREMDISRSHLWKVRNGKGDPGTDFVTKAMTVTGMSFDELFIVADVVRSSNTAKSGT